MSFFRRFLGAFRRLILYFEPKNGGRARPSSAHSCIATRCWPHSSHLPPPVQFFCTLSGRARSNQPESCSNFLSPRPRAFAAHGSARADARDKDDDRRRANHSKWRARASHGPRRRHGRLVVKQR